jgi:hypothetical protein
MRRVCSALIDSGGNARRPGFGSPFRLFNRGTFDRIRRQSLRQLVGECLILRRFAVLRGPFHFCQQWIFPTHIKTPLVSAEAVGG